MRLTKLGKFTAKSSEKSLSGDDAQQHSKSSAGEALTAADIIRNMSEEAMKVTNTTSQRVEAKSSSIVHSSFDDCISDK